MIDRAGAAPSDVVAMMSAWAGAACLQPRGGGRPEELIRVHGCAIGSTQSAQLPATAEEPDSDEEHHDERNADKDCVAKNWRSDDAAHQLALPAQRWRAGRCPLQALSSLTT